MLCSNTILVNSRREPCRATLPTIPAASLLPGDGKNPVARHKLTCPECGDTFEVLDFGKLDGIKKTRKKDLWKEKKQGTTLEYLTKGNPVELVKVWFPTVALATVFFKALDHKTIQPNSCRRY